MKTGGVNKYLLGDEKRICEKGNNSEGEKEERGIVKPNAGVKFGNNKGKWMNEIYNLREIILFTMRVENRSLYFKVKTDEKVKDGSP